MCQKYEGLHIVVISPRWLYRPFSPISLQAKQRKLSFGALLHIDTCPVSEISDPTLYDRVPKKQRYGATSPVLNIQSICICDAKTRFFACRHDNFFKHFLKTKKFKKLRRSLASSVLQFGMRLPCKIGRILKTSTDTKEALSCHSLTHYRRLASDHTPSLSTDLLRRGTDLHAGNSLCSVFLKTWFTPKLFVRYSVLLVEMSLHPEFVMRTPLSRTRAKTSSWAKVAR